MALFTTLDVIKRHYASFVLLVRSVHDAGDVSAAVHTYRVQGEADKATV